MPNRNHYIAFDRTFFKKHQRTLLWLLNTRVLRAWFRWVLRINGLRSCVGRRKILSIAPNAITWQAGFAYKRTAWATFKTKLYQTEFRDHVKFGKRLYRAFRPLWWAMHFWDWLVADRIAPALSFGFSTLTVYPDANPETSSVDGWVTNGGTNLTWATIHDAVTGSSADDDDVGNNPVVIQAGTTAWNDLRRAFYLFDTAAIPDSAGITDATLSIHGGSNGKSDAFSMTVNVYSSAPASSTALATADFDAVGTTAFSTAITVASWSDAGYNDYALNASGLAAISKTGVSKFSLRSTADATNTEPTHSNGAIAYIGADHAENAATSQDPKLVVTYSLATTLSESLTVADSLLKLPNRTLSESTPLTDLILRTIQRSLGESLSISDVIEKVKLQFKILTDSVSLSDTLNRLSSRILSESLTIADAVLRITGRTLTESISITDVFSRLYGRVLTETISITESIRRFLNNLDVRFSRKFPSNPGSYSAKYTKKGPTYEKKYPDPQ